MNFFIKNTLLFLQVFNKPGRFAVVCLDCERWRALESIRAHWRALHKLGDESLSSSDSRVCAVWHTRQSYINVPELANLTTANNRFADQDGNLKSLRFAALDLKFRP